MKTFKKALLATTALGMMGVGSVAAASQVALNGKENTPIAVETNTNEDNHRLVIKIQPMFAAPAVAGFDFTSYLLDGLKTAGGSFAGYIASDVGKFCFKKVLTSMGFDMRSDEEKKFDQIGQQLKSLQNSLTQGITDVKRKIVEIHNKDIMNGVLGLLDQIQTPVASKFAILGDIAAKEDKKEDTKELDKEKQEFLVGLTELKFEKLSQNNLWNAVENLAKNITVPYSADKSLKLFDLYEDTYGVAEKWDYMTIQPRKNFIAYVGFLVNGLCQLAQLSANYKISQLNAGDSNIKGYEVGVQAMLKAVNDLNSLFKDELVKLDEIQKKHDQDHLITYRERTFDTDGNIVVKDGITLSTSLLPVTPADNDHNYISYENTAENPTETIKNFNSPDTVYYENVIYTLDCSNQEDLYKKIFADYDTYVKAVGIDSKSFTVKDYLVKAGFTCKDKDLFNKAKGFYKTVEDTVYDDSNFWTTDKNDELRIYYYNFEKKNQTYDVYDAVHFHASTPFSSGDYSKQKRDAINDYYLCFVNPDQKTIAGKLQKTVLDKVGTKTAQGTNYKMHFKGHRKSDGNNLDKVEIQEGQI